MEKLSRRKLLTGTAKAAPLLALASSKSVWAAGCMSPSGALSNNFSNISYTCAGTQGATPGFWKNHVESWPSPMFAGLMLFKDQKFGIVWDWTQGNTTVLGGKRVLWGWSSSIEDMTSGEASKWSDLGELCPQFIKHNTLWESLQGEYTGGTKKAEYHMAAALLNAYHDDVDYGYDPMHLLEYCRKAESHSDPKVFDRFIESLVKLNERGLDKDIGSFNSEHLNVCYYPPKANEGLEATEKLDATADNATSMSLFNDEKDGKKIKEKGKGKKIKEKGKGNKTENIELVEVSGNVILGDSYQYPKIKLPS